ncbi:MAG: J domain-containing protein [Kofleriaceae bacterium]|nr:J domain-containing protein [Kofleriaceae bacterium]
MSSVPAEIAGIGSTAQRLRVSPGFDPLKAAVGPEEYFVLSRIDGNQSLREVLLATGLPVERGIAIVTRLRSIGALLLPGETTAPPPAAVPHPTAASGTRPNVVPPRSSAPPQNVPHRALTPAVGVRIVAPPPASATATTAVTHDLQLPNPTADELAAMAEDVEINEQSRRRILAMARLIQQPDLHALLGVPPGADAKALKRAYFTLSKEVHPDRYYGKRLGSFAERLSLVFEATSRAYAVLTGGDKSRASASHSALRVDQDQPQTPQEYAAELFERACQLEVGGDALGAMKLFAAAVRVDPQARYLRRASSCALAAEQPKSAVEYAKKAYAMSPNDVSSARLLASAFRAAGKLSDAEDVLVMAMALKSENDVLTAELRHDLAEVRRLLAVTQ